MLPDVVSGFTLLADVEELDDAYLVDVDVAGVKRSDIDIEVGGLREVKSEQNDADLLTRERDPLGKLRNEGRRTRP